VEGYTKGDLVRYYEQVSGLLVPHLVGRPVHMLRLPDGIEGKSFYQRQAPEHLPDWFDTLTLRPEDGVGGTDGHRHMICESRDAVLYLVNLGSIDLHPWMSRRGSLASPDYAVIDLDPKGAPFRDVVRVARHIGRLLRGIGLAPVVKTSGKSGLHICIALEPGYTFEQARMFCEAVARAVCSEIGDIATVERAVGSRGGRVYVDFLQNRAGQTVVPPYVVRPVRGATVSTPLAWDELTNELDPGCFTIETVLERFERLGDLFGGGLGVGLGTGGTDLVAAVDRLGEYLE
jgi:bifunctional non-homologous end joining protein LigD